MSVEESVRNADRTMPSTADVVVIGAGLYGAAVAFHLARLGVGRVLLVDQNMPASGDSGRTVGMIRHHYSNDITARLALRGADAIRRWSDYVGVADAGFVQSGYLLAVPEGMEQAAMANVARLQRLGLETAFLSPDEVRTIEPLLNVDDVAGGAYEPTSGFADGKLMILGWIAAGAALGLRACFHNRVQSIVARGGRVAAVRTDLGTVSTERVVVAAGAWARPLVAQTGWDPPVRLRRVEVSVWRVPPGALIPQVVCADAVSGLVVRPDRANEFLAVAYTRERDLDELDGFDYEATPRHDGALRERFRNRFPSLTHARPVRGWAGPYDFTPDWHPIVGEAPHVDGLFLGFGTSGHGFKLAPSIGESLACLVAGTDPPIDLDELSPSRFETGANTLQLAYGPGARA